MNDQLLIPDPEARRQREAIEFDALVAEMCELLANNGNPWKASTDNRSNWMIASFGQHDGENWYLTTDNIHASEYEGDAESDARLCALAKRLLPALIDELKKARKHERD